MSREKKKFISLLNVVAAIAVVMLHTNGCFWKFSTDNYWKTANIIESVMYFAVPVFFMITGVTLMDYNERYSLKEYYKKRINKTVIPFLTWSIIGIVFKGCMGLMSFEEITIRYLIDNIFNTSIIDIYWFFIPLFAIYISIPLFAEVPKEKRKKIFSYIVIVSFIFNNLLPFIFEVANIGITYNNNLNIYVGYSYLIYVLLGYLLDTCDINKAWKRGIYVLAVLGLLMHIGGTYYLSMEAGEIIQTFKGYNNVPCILYSTGVFLFVKENGNRIMENKMIDKIINICAEYTFSVYLMHWFIIVIIGRYIPVNIYSIIYRVGFPFIIFGICMGIAMMMKKIPIMKKIVP